MPLFATELFTLQDAATATGNGTAQSVKGFHFIRAHVTGAAGLTSATIQWEGSIDGTNFDNLFAQRVDSGVIDTSYAVAASDEVLFIVNIAGLTHFRARLSAITAGTGSVTVKSIATVNIGEAVVERDASGLVIQGSVAHDAAGAGNPVPIGGQAAEGTPTAVADADRVQFWVDQYGTIRTFIGDKSGPNNVKVSAGSDALDQSTIALTSQAKNFGLAPDLSWDRLRTVGDTAGAGLGVLATSPRTPDASEVKVVRHAGLTSTTRATILTPSAGKKVRVLSVRYSTQDATAHGIEIYFGTGANITTNAGSEIDEARAAADDSTIVPFFAPDGAGTIGAADEVLSGRVGATLSSGTIVIVTYREE